MKSIKRKTNRRIFFGLLAKGVAALGLTSILPASARNTQAEVSDLEAWFNRLKGKHKMVFDAISANDGFQTIWAFTFLNTNNKVGIPDNDLGVMVVLRGKAIGLAMTDALWKKYKLGKHFKQTDLATNAPSERNLYWNPQLGEMPDAGMSIKSLMERGVMFCVYETAITVNSRMMAKANGHDAEEVKETLLAGLIPGIRLVPSGVLALNRAQERGASYCYAG